MLDSKLEELLELRNALMKKKEELSNIDVDFDKYNNLLKELNNKIADIDRRIYFARDPDNSNGIIDLREDSNGVYNIFLSGTDIYVGFIEYNGYHVSRRKGDVGCKIDSKYRGKNYAYYANVLLGDLLYRRGIEDFWGTAFKDNVSSIKLMEKYGGIKIAEDEVPGVVLYECKTKPLEEIDKISGKSK